jgi:Na+/H+ antiporter NhaD/arsenite permease-like protein
MSGDAAEATTVSGLATVIFTSGLLSAFLVNDIVCLVMTPFVLHVAQRLGLPPIPICSHWPPPRTSEVRRRLRETRRTCSSARCRVSANIIVVERAAAYGVHVGFRDYLRIGLPVTVATLAWGSAWLWMSL